GTAARNPRNSVKATSGSAERNLPKNSSFGRQHRFTPLPAQTGTAISLTLFIEIAENSLLSIGSGQVSATEPRASTNRIGVCVWSMIISLYKSLSRIAQTHNKSSL